MQDFSNDLVQFISTYQIWSGPAIALLSFLESLFIVGLFVPATGLLIATGALIASDVINFWPVALGGIIGAFLGDAVSFSIGRYFGIESTKKWPLSNHRRLMIKTRLFFKRHGAKAVFFGRFMGPFRSTVPTIAGIMGLNPLKFQIANLLSALIWAPLYMAPGYFGTVSIEAATGTNQASTIVLILTGLSIVLGLWLIILLFRKK